MEEVKTDDLGLEPETGDGAPEIVSDTAIAAEPATEVEVEEKLDPRHHVAVDLNASGDYVIYENTGRPFARTLSLGGKTYEHVAEHRGVWAYRHLG